MKLKKKGLIAVSSIIVALTVASLILIPAIRNGYTGKYLKEDLKNIDNISLIAHCTEVDGVSNSVAGFKESVRLGANAVIVDLCFNKVGVPVMCENYTLAENSESVESLFKAMTNEKYNKIKVYLKIVQLSDISLLNSLAVKYNLIDRLFLIGIDKDHYGLIDTDDTIIPFLLNYKFSENELDSVKDGSFESPKIIEEYGATGLVINKSQITAELVDTLNDFGIIFIVDGIESKPELCKVLINNAVNAVVPDIAESKELLDTWAADMQSRYKASVEKSIKELSKKAE